MATIRQLDHVRLNRRQFLRQVAWGGSGVLLLGSARSALGFAANGKLNVAIIGIGGRGRWFVETMPTLDTNVVALCDVNEDRGADSFQRLPKARKFHDYRVMLEEMGREIDAVVIATPDHSHAPASMLAMKSGKQVYCEKPLTNTVQEARRLREAAGRFKVATQMGNQGTASPGFRQAVEIIRRGILGDIREVHAWNDSGGPGRRPRPTEAQPAPATLKWDLWLGPAPFRPFHRVWLNWHGWREFGTGNLGNWASHTFNLAFMALDLQGLWRADASAGTSEQAGPRLHVQAEVSEVDRDSMPRWETIRYDCPARGTLPPVRLTWHNGGGSGFRPKIEELLGRKLDWGDAGERKWADFAGLLIIGSKGRLHTNAHNTVFELLPKEQFQDFRPPTPSLPQSPGHEREWVEACRGGPRAVSNFDYAGPLAELVLLGNVATQFPGPLVYDPRAGQFVGHADASHALQREYRSGFEL